MSKPGKKFSMGLRQHKNYLFFFGVLVGLVIASVLFPYRHVLLSSTPSPVARHELHFDQALSWAGKNETHDRFNVLIGDLKRFNFERQDFPVKNLGLKIVDLVAANRTERKLPSPTSSKRIVYSCRRQGTCGGLADRQKGMVGAYVLASMMGRRFGVDIPYPCDISLFLAPNKVDWKVSNSEMNGKNVKKMYTVDDGAAQFAKRLLSNENLDAEFPSDVTAITWNMEVVQFLLKHPAASKVDWLKNKSVPEIYKQVLLDLFTLKPDVQHELEKFEKAKPPNTKLICGQLRLGNQGSIPDVDSFHSMDHYPIFANFLSKYNNSRQYRIFVASDSVKIIEKVEKAFPGMIVSLPGPITHVDKSSGTNTCDGLKKAILDEYAMSLCDVLLISESGLGKMAAFLRNSDEQLYLFHDVRIKAFKRGDGFVNKKGW